jgi:DNA modification methylase
MDGGKVHPTQKPELVFKKCILNYSQPGMTIFDPFAGSGTTAIACLETGRNYILVEKEMDYVEIINKRISTWKEQGRLFPAHVI